MEPIFHIIIPAFILMAFFPKLDKKLVIVMAILIELLMDADNFVNGYHRILTHNIFWILILTIAFYFLMNKESGFMAFYYGISHLIFDLGNFGVAFLWPIVNKLFAMDLTASPANPLFFSIKFFMFTFEELRAVNYTDFYLTQYGTSLIVFVILAYVIWKITKKEKLSV